MSSRRLWPVLLLAPLSVVAGHQVLYTAVHTHALGTGQEHGHGHIGLLATLALPLALLGAGWFARRATRDVVVPALVLLTGAQVMAFAAMEAAERLAAGGELGALVRSPLLWVGVAMQITVALVLGLTLRRAGQVAMVLRLGNTVPMGPAQPAIPAIRPTGKRALRTLAATRWLLERGPPGLLGP